ncbi:MAG: radical SAM protein [Candidatus Omnitrophica bacterium]|jgi:wyosine [tRNA(Phe)-imidazoG37] synthetase (radical SAM superfamily)|nr:radical SAM protein [Candidatus Omnitrophota bacterium]
MNYFYGPVPSRRLGFSLGVSITPKKICTLDCLYCQLGKTTKKTVKRFFYVDLIEFKKELTKIINNNPKIDYISISGSGEPTLHKRLDKIIDTIKETTNNEYRVCVITNSSLLYKKEVRKELKKADLIIPSLDAATNKSFSRIDKPHKQIIFKKVVDGLINLRKEFKGKIWLEIMLLGGINDSLKEARIFKKIVAKINPDKVQLNLPIRPSGASIVLPDYERVKKIKKIIGKKCEIVSSFYKAAQKKFSESAQEDITKYLNIRPATMRDLEKSVGLEKNVLAKQIEKMLDLGLIIKKIYNRKVYFICDRAA